MNNNNSYFGYSHKFLVTLFFKQYLIKLNIA